MRYAKIGALAGAVVPVAAACSTGSSASQPAPSAAPGGSAAPSASAAATQGHPEDRGELPLSGGAAADGQPTLKGAQLAVEQANAAGGIGGYKLEVLPLDHSVNGKYNEQQGAQDMQTFVGDAAVIGVMGPYNSAVAKVQIPISNDAGLLQCSPANTNERADQAPRCPQLPQELPGADQLHPRRGDRRIQGPAMATYAYEKLGLKNMLIVDDVTTFGKGVADNVRGEVEGARRHGRASASALVPTPPTSTGSSPHAKTKNPDGVYYGGVVTSGAGLLLKQMRQQGLNIPFTGPRRNRQRPRRRRGIPHRDRRQGQRGRLLRNDSPRWATSRARPTSMQRSRRPSGTMPPSRHRCVQRPRARLRDGHPEVARRVPQDQPRRRHGGHPRGRPRLGDGSLAFLRHGPWTGVVRQERRHRGAVHLVLDRRPRPRRASATGCSRSRSPSAPSRPC